jgi:diadenosine tetraphosphatase ApaH/serine/threonine PP2A family protein phosphatase
MQLAFISDIHSNLEALQTCLAVIDQTGCDAIVCLGDTVGYGPSPNECTEIVRERSSLCLAGNHDHAAIGFLDTAYFNEYARQAIVWTSSVLKSENVEFLKGLEIATEKWSTLFCHSTPFQPEMWNYIFTTEEARLNFAFFEQFACFIGHSHQPFIVGLTPEGEIDVCPEPEAKLDPAFRYIINVGSVGQPRDGNPASCIAFYDIEARHIRLQRVPYDVGRVQERMVQAGLHPFLVERLAYGR